ncbi:hypothetical protein LXA43DRAFT_75685 [Ganoderma leucocontextum]|nr:hypothetical protein LXA43DRAFT_75685 [Ganoderma leucocontextum]
MFQDGLVVTGHPGIGKSLFLLYALGAALEAHIPVVFCQDLDFCRIFDATGAREFAFGCDDRFAVPCHALYLVDSNYGLHSPPSCFLGRSGVLVHTVGPGDRTDWEWSERSYNALFWIMGVWTRAEMQALQRTAEALTHPKWTNRTPPGKSVYTPLELFDILGPCPRKCAHMAGRAKTEAAPKST